MADQIKINSKEGEKNLEQKKANYQNFIKMRMDFLKKVEVLPNNPNTQWTQDQIDSFNEPYKRDSTYKERIDYVRNKPEMSIEEKEKLIRKLLKQKVEVSSYHFSRHQILF